MSSLILKFITYVIIFIAILNIFAGHILELFYNFHGWKFILPENIPKKVIFISTETIEEDSTLLAALSCKVNLFNHYYITKKETFNKMFFLKGAFYVDRSIQNNLVKIISDRLRHKDNFSIFVFPEGATRNVKEWKSGFYHIAKNTGADIAIVGINHNTKTISIDNIFKPSDNYEKDLKFVQDRLKKYPVAIKEKCNLFDKEVMINEKHAFGNLTPIHKIL